MKDKLKEIHIYCDYGVYDKVVSEAKVSGSSLSSACVNLITAGLKKKDNDYKEFIELFDKRDRDIVSFLKEQSDQNFKNINDALTHFAELILPKNDNSTILKKGDPSFAKKFFDEINSD